MILLSLHRQSLPDGHGQFMEVTLLIIRHTPTHPCVPPTSSEHFCKEVTLLTQQALAFCLHDSNCHFVPQKKRCCSLLFYLLIYLFRGGTSEQGAESERERERERGRERGREGREEGRGERGSKAGYSLTAQRPTQGSNS